MVAWLYQLKITIKLCEYVYTSFKFASLYIFELYYVCTVYPTYYVKLIFKFVFIDSGTKKKWHKKRIKLKYISYSLSYHFNISLMKHYGNCVTESTPACLLAWLTVVLLKSIPLLNMIIIIY